MRSYKTLTENRGTTIIMDSASEAMQEGAEYLNHHLQKIKGYTGKIKVKMLARDGKPKTVTKPASKFISDWNECAEQYQECCDAITRGDRSRNQTIAELAEILRDMAVQFEPSLACTFHGYYRSEDGITAAAELVAAGEEKCCFERKRSGDGVAQREGDGAFKIVINTDVCWLGKPDDNAAVMGALVLLLQSRGPVEIWIQQGWCGEGDENGVTLFKLDFNGAFDPSQLCFWLGHEYKDRIYSFAISRALGRTDTSTSKSEEIQNDLYLRGDWMKLHGVTDLKLKVMPTAEKHAVMAQWIASQAVQILHMESAETLA